MPIKEFSFGSIPDMESSILMIIFLTSFPSSAGQRKKIRGDFRPTFGIRTGVKQLKPQSIRCWGKTAIPQNCAKSAKFLNSEIPQNFAKSAKIDEFRKILQIRQDFVKFTECWKFRKLSQIPKNIANSVKFCNFRKVSQIPQNPGKSAKSRKKIFSIT